MDEKTVHAQLAEVGLRVGTVHRNLPSPELTARSLARKEGILAANGALVVTTGERTGRSPQDRYIVADEGAAGVAWGGANQPCSTEVFDHHLRLASAFLRGRDAYVFDGFVGAEPAYRLPVRVVAEATWHALFAHTLLVRPEPVDLEGFEPGFTVIACGALRADDAAAAGASLGFATSAGAPLAPRRAPDPAPPARSSASRSAAASCSSSAPSTPARSRRRSSPS